MNSTKLSGKVILAGFLGIILAFAGAHSVLAGDAVALSNGMGIFSTPLASFTYIRYTPEGKPFMVQIDGYGKYNHLFPSVDNLDAEFAKSEAWIKGTETR